MVTKIGTAGRDFLHGTNVADLLKGLGGNDDLYGAGGSDRIFGGIGNDKLFGDAGNDFLFGEAGNDTLHGGTGNDFLDGGTGNDFLYGDSGNDLILPGAGADVVNGGTGIDTVSYANAASSVIVSVGDLPGFAPSGAAASDTLTSIETVIGSAFHDYLAVFGNGTALGGAGDDDLVSATDPGPLATVTLRGDNGNDILHGGLDRDYFWLQYNKGADSILGFTSGQDKFVISAKEFGLPAALVGQSLPAGRFSYNPPDWRAQDADQRIIHFGQFLWADPDGSGPKYHAVPIADVSGVSYDALIDFLIVA